MIIHITINFSNIIVIINHHVTKCNTACYNMRINNSLYFYISMFCTDRYHKQSLGEVLHSVGISIVTSLLKSWIILEDEESSSIPSLPNLPKCCRYRRICFIIWTIWYTHFKILCVYMCGVGACLIRGCFVITFLGLRSNLCWIHIVAPHPMGLKYIYKYKSESL